MADDFMKYLQGNQSQVDPYSVDPFVEEEDKKKNDNISDALPFKFTQFALNPAGAAATGRSGIRTAMARSPFTTGRSYPTTEIQPEGLPTRDWDLPGNLVLNGMNPLYAAQQFDQMKGTLSPEQIEQLGPMTQVQGYDVKELLGEDAYNEFLAPGVEFQGAENKATQNMYRNIGLLPMGSKIDFADKTVQRNLASQDLTFNPESYWQGGSFEQQNATPNPFMQSQGEGEVGVDPGVGPGHWETRGSGDSEHQAWVPDMSTPASIEDTNEQFGTRLGDTGLRFDPSGGAETVSGKGLNWDELDSQTQETLMREAHNGNMASRAWKQIAPALSIALISAAATQGAGAVGGALSGAGAGAGGGAGAVTATTAIESGALASTPATTSATGLAGGMGMQAGTMANIVNQLGPQVIMKGATAVGAALGLPVDNPVVSSIVQLGMSMYGGTPSSSGTMNFQQAGLAAGNAVMGGIASSMNQDVGGGESNPGFMNAPTSPQSILSPSVRTPSYLQGTNRNFNNGIQSLFV